MKQPLAFRMRPQHLDDIIGQQHLIGEGKVLRKCLEAKRLFSMIFYGPPGTGKTTLAMVLANELGMPYRLFNAVTGNKKDLETIFQEAKFYEGLVVIIDEVHRLNKDKQDLLLPHVENGNITHSVNLPDMQITQETKYRICIINKNIPDMISSVSTALGNHGINIENMASKGKKDYAYTILETNDEVSEELVQRLQEREGIVMARLIVK